MKKVLLGTTGLVAAGVIASSAMAAEISVGGALDLRISGTNDFEFEYAAEELTGRNRESFFNQDHEIQFRATGVGDATGITYGVNLELELSSGGGPAEQILDSSGTLTNVQNTLSGDNAAWDEAWGFIRGGFGEFRFGNEDSVTDILKIGGHFNNRGTGGIDGAQLTAKPIRPADSGEATKVLYFTPNVAGFQGGVSYAINGGDQGFRFGSVNNIQNVVEAGVNWQGNFAGFDLGAYGGLTSFEPLAAVGQDRTFNYAFGALAGFGGWSLALGYFDNEEDASSVDYVLNAGIGGEIGGVGLSAAYQYQENNFSNVGNGDISYFVVSADTPILPGVAIRGDLAYEDGDNDTGFNGVIQLRTTF